MRELVREDDDRWPASARFPSAIAMRTSWRGPSTAPVDDQLARSEPAVDASLSLASVGSVAARRVASWWHVSTARRNIGRKACILATSCS